MLDRAVREGQRRFAQLQPEHGFETAEAIGGFAAFALRLELLRIIEHIHIEAEARDVEEHGAVRFTGVDDAVFAAEQDIDRCLRFGRNAQGPCIVIARSAGKQTEHAVCMDHAHRGLAQCTVAADRDDHVECRVDRFLGKRGRMTGIFRYFDRIINAFRVEDLLGTFEIDLTVSAAGNRVCDETVAFHWVSPMITYYPNVLY